MALCAPAFDGNDQMRSAWSTFLARNTNTPIEFDLATRIPICFVTRNDRAGARHRVVQNFLLHAMDLVSN